MACGDYSAFTKYWAEGQFFDAVLCPFYAQLGATVTGMFLYGAIAIGLYIYSGSVILPVAVTIVLAAVVAVTVPAIALQMGIIVLVLSIALAGTTFLKRRLKTR